jgi:hypothetical protein
MNIDTFKTSLTGAEPPPGLSVLLRALWLDAKGDWGGAHGIAQDLTTPDGARIHAYLHRKEGDGANARYWYRSARVTVENGSLEEEWEQLVLDFLDED